MHLLKYASVVLSIAAVALLAIALGDEGRARKTRLAAGVACLVATVATVTLVVGLLHAQRPICTTLGGQWIAEEESCRDEFCGNGNNDPKNGLTFD